MSLIGIGGKIKAMITHITKYPLSEKLALQLKLT